MSTPEVKPAPLILHFFILNLVLVCLIFIFFIQELEATRRRLREIEDEAAKLRKMTAQVERELGMSIESGSNQDVSMAGNTTINSEAQDARSIYIGNVDYAATPEELHAHFQSCGTINRITILCDKLSGHPKGFAYIEFAEESSVKNSEALNESLFRNRLLKVTPKRTNVPGFSQRGGRGGAGRGNFRGAFRAGRGFRGGRSRRSNYAPY